MTALTCIQLPCVYIVHRNVSAALIYMALNELEILMTNIDSVNIHSMVWLKSPEPQLPKTFFWIENQLNIRNVWEEMC